MREGDYSVFHNLKKINKFPLEFGENLCLDTHCVSQTSLVAARERGQWLNPGLSV